MQRCDEEFSWLGFLFQDAFKHWEDGEAGSWGSVLTACIEVHIQRVAPGFVFSDPIQAASKVVRLSAGESVSQRFVGRLV